MNLLTLGQAAEQTAVSIDTLRREIKDGNLPCVRIRDTVRVDADDLQSYIERSKVTRDLKSLTE